MTRAASIVEQAVEHGITPKANSESIQVQNKFVTLLKEMVLSLLSKKWELKYLQMLADHVSDNGIERC